MTFHVPSKFAGLSDDVARRFRLLLAKRVVTGVTEIQFNKWLDNFSTDEDQYLAARLLENLTFRSEQMVGSAIAHILQCILPSELRFAGVAFKSIEELLNLLGTAHNKLPVRFVQVDDAAQRQPGKSGPVIMRELNRLGRVDKSYFCHAKDLHTLPDSVRCLVFVDDMLGTGKQFGDFADAIKLQQYQANKTLIYCPLAAYESGLNALAARCAWLKVCPVEVFGEKHKFFRGTAERPDVWAVDQVNLVEDVRSHVETLAVRGGFTKPNKFALDLLIGFHHATPNNTMQIMYFESPSWQNLLIR